MYIYQLIIVQFIPTLAVILTIFESNLELGLKPSFSIHVSGDFFVPGSNQFQNCNSVIKFPQVINRVFPFFFFSFTMSASSYHQRDIILCLCPYQTKLTLMLLSTLTCLFCFYPWPYILNVAVAVRQLMFSVKRPTYSVIYSEKYALYLGKF